MTDVEDTKPTLHAEMKSVARARILRAAQAVVVRRGLDSTVEDVASEGGVSRRTVFRYFPSHGQLLAAAVSQIIDDFQTIVPEPPGPSTDLDRWLLETATAFHAFNAEHIGQAFWDIYTGRPGLPPELKAVLDDRLEARFSMARAVTEGAWRAAGGEGRPPAWVADAFLLQLSGFAYHGVQAAAHPRTPAETGRFSAAVLSAVLDRALREQADPTS